ncbi:quinol:electron acceptor oxidoreductase subunit ActD [Candidatus Nitrospira bockiana]
MAHAAEQTRLFALYQPSTAIEPILDRLRAQGVSRESVDVLTAVPQIPSASARWGPLPFFVITIVAGLIGIGVGVFFSGGTAALYPLRTGGKPIVAFPVVGIISYEVMMLLAVVTTFIVLIVRIVRLSRAAEHYDVRIDEGFLGLVVRLDATDPRRDRIESALRADGLAELRAA